MNNEQIKEVMRRADEIADYAWKEGISDGAYSNAKQDRECRAESRTELEAYLRTIGEPAGYSLPAGSIGAKKFAQVGGGFTPVGLVFSRGESAMAITEHGRVYWDRDLVHPISGEPESMNAELLEALKGMVDAHAIPSSYCKERPVYDQARAAIARAESAIETPAKVSPCAGHAVQQEADDLVGLRGYTAATYAGRDAYKCHFGTALGGDAGTIDEAKANRQALRAIAKATETKQPKGE